MKLLQVLMVALLGCVVWQQYAAFMLIQSETSENSDARERGRYQLVQLSAMRRDQFMVDTQTGRLWEVVCTRPGKDVGECEERKLDPVMYSDKMMTQGDNVSPLSSKKAQGLVGRRAQLGEWVTCSAL